MEGSSVSYGKATGLLPIIDLLRAYFQLEAGDDGRKVREKLTGKLLSLDRALEPSLFALLWLLDAPVDDPQWLQLDPPQRRRRTLHGQIVETIERLYPGRLAEHIDRLAHHASRGELWDKACGSARARAPCRRGGAGAAC